MLVGEDGRIVPFRRFKGIAVSVIVMMVAAVLAAIALSIAYIHQGRQLDRMRQDLENSKQQAARLRDEKDVLLARLVVTGKLQPKKQPSSATTAQQDEPDTTETENQPAPAPASESSPQGESTQSEDTSPPEPQHVEPAADIRQFDVGYAPEKALLEASFRIYNISRPKVPLSGRIVVIFKKQNESPIRWLPVPNVQLKNGRPSGERGQAFKINNYRTMHFKAFGMKPPIEYDTASVFVFSAKEDLLLNEDFGFKIDYKPPPKPAVKAHTEDAGASLPKKRAAERRDASSAEKTTVQTNQGQAASSQEGGADSEDQSKASQSPDDNAQPQGESPTWKPQPAKRVNTRDSQTKPLNQGDQK